MCKWGLNWFWIGVCKIIELRFGWMVVTSKPEFLRVGIGKGSGALEHRSHNMHKSSPTQHYSVVFLGSLQKLSINDRPILPTLLNFPVSSGDKLNLAVEISDHYSFSIQLLEDESGNILSLISHDVGNSHERILQEVFKKWLNGQGKPIKTWKTIVQVLKDLKMLRLAERLESELTQ